MAPIFIIGCGWVGTQVAGLWLAAGAEVKALARSGESAERLAARGITPVAGDLDRPASLRDLPLDRTWIYYFAPPPGKGATDPRMQAFVAALEQAKTQPCGVIYLSTSGIYGDCQGAWVDEDRQPAPLADRARRRLDAEQLLRGWGRIAGVPVMVLRVGGIYGPGRLPLERLKRGDPVLRQDQSPFSNRIHGDDLATVCVAALERGRADRIYNVCDDAPTTMTDYFFTVADALGLPRPPEIDLAEARRVMSPAMLSYLTESRRLRNRRLHQELGVHLRYPNLASGLAASV